MADTQPGHPQIIPPAKGHSEPVPEPIAPEPTNIAMTGLAAGPVRWGPDLDAIAGDVQKALALLPPVEDPPPLVKDFESPVFWASTVLPIALAITAYVFHHDLSSLAVSIAGLGAAVTTLGYTIYRGIYRHAHLSAVSTASAMKSGQAVTALAVATTGRPF